MESGFFNSYSLANRPPRLNKLSLVLIAESHQVLQLRQAALEFEEAVSEFFV